MSKGIEPVSVEEEFFPTSAAMWQRRLPWLRLLRGFRMAIGPRRMVIALLAVFLWAAGDLMVSYQTFSAYPDTYNGPRTLWPWETPEKAFLDFAEQHPESVQGRQWAISQSVWWSSPLKRLTDPLLRVVQPARGVLLHGRLSSTLLSVGASTLVGILISVIFGGAISRMTAIDFAGKGELSIRTGLRFSTRYFLSYLGAPAIAVMGFAACWIFLFFAGLLGSLPVVGELLVSWLWILPLLAGFVMALVLLGLGLGWPLMVAAVSTEASDAFDGLSRAYSYLLNRPWYLGFLTLFALAYGAVLLLFVDRMVIATDQLTARTFQISYYGDENSTDRPRKDRSFAFLDNLTGGLSKGMDVTPQARSGRVFWSRVLYSIPSAFTFSYFWTMATIIYFLLRKREDAIPLNEVGMPTLQRSPKTPIVGIPAAELREASKQENPST